MTFSFYRPDHRLRPLLEKFGLDEEDQDAITPIGDLKREIHQYGGRSCDKEASRDNLVYYLGFAFEVNKALDLDSLALCGLLALPTRAFAEIFDEDDLPPPPTVIGMLRYALEQPRVLEWARAMGIWMQWKRMAAIYRAEVTDFKESHAFHGRGWRGKFISPAQHYLIGEIVRILGVEVPPLVNRWDAFCFIDEQGGNPRFRAEPPVPAAWWEA